MDYGIAINPCPRPPGQVLHRLLTQAFAPMEGRIDPPSSIWETSAETVSTRCETEDLVIAQQGDRVIGCLFAQAQGTTYLLGKIAVARDLRQKGIARAMVEAASERAAYLGLEVLELQSRVELTENHAAFYSLGFRQSDTYTHPGYAVPTSLVFTRPLPPRGPLS